MKKFIFFFLTILPFYLIAGGGWTQSKGSGFFKVGQSFIIGNNYFDSNGNVVVSTPSTLSVYTTAFYGEYGITDRITVIGYIPFFVRTTQNEIRGSGGDFTIKGDAINSFGDTDISIKYGITKNKPVAVAATLTLGLPLGKHDGGESGLLRTGDGEFNQMVGIDVAGGLPYGFFTSAGVAFNHRTNDYSNEFRYGLELGWAKGKFLASIRFYGIKPLGEQELAIPEVPGIFNDRIEYLSFTPSALYKVKENFGLVASVGGALYGKHVLANPNFDIGVFLTL